MQGLCANLRELTRAKHNSDRVSVNSLDTYFTSVSLAHFHYLLYYYCSIYLGIRLVAPVGANLDSVVKVLEDRFSDSNYTSNTIRLSALIKNLEGLETELKE